MPAVLAFLIAAAVALAIAAGVVWALARPFHAVVVDLCGTAERARFWTAYVSVLFVLAPLLAVSFASLQAGVTGLNLIGAVFWSVLALFAALLVFGFNVFKPSAQLFRDARGRPVAWRDE
jgi:hypothetical protein